MKYAARDKPNGKKSYPKMPWVVTAKCQQLVDSLKHRVKLPKEWPRLRKVFSETNFMTTSEALAQVGPFGAAIMQHFDCDTEYRDLFIRCIYGMSDCMLKASDPTSRADAKSELSVVGTKLEKTLPLKDASTVRHIALSHPVDILQACGPYNTCNMLDHERYVNIYHMFMNIMYLTSHNKVLGVLFWGMPS